MDQVDEDKCLWRIQWIQEEHHCRRFTEVKEDESGELEYLDGELWFSKELASRQLDFKITLVSTDSLRTYKNLSDGNIANLRIHPNLLYITRYDDIRKSGDLHQAKRLFDQESRIPLWRVELRVVNGEVDWWTESEAQPGGYYQRICQMDKDEDGNWILPLQMLHLVVVIPMQRTNATGLKIREALLLRRAMYEELDEDQWEKLVRELERFYKKDGKTEMDRFSLQFDLTLDPGTLLQTRLQTLLSEPILNSKNKASANFDLHGSISHEKSCTQFQRTTHLFLKFVPTPVGLQCSTPSPAACVSAGQPELSVRFVTRHKHRQEYTLDKRLNQPTDVRVEPYWIEFDIPYQHDHVVHDIYKANYEIYIEGYRPKDKYRTKTKVKFHYQTHNQEKNSFCIFCSSNPDKIGLDLLSEENLSPPLPRKRSKLQPNGDALDRDEVDNDSIEDLAGDIPKDGLVSNGLSLKDEEHVIHWDEVDSSCKRTIFPPKYKYGSDNSQDICKPRTTTINDSKKLSPKKLNNNGKANGKEKQNGSKASSAYISPSYPVSPRKKPLNPNTLSIYIFILFPTCFIFSLFVFNHQAFPSLVELLSMWQLLFYVVCLPPLYKILYTRYNLTQSASTVLAFSLCFIFIHLVSYYIF